MSNSNITYWYYVANLAMRSIDVPERYWAFGAQLDRIRASIPELS